MTPGEARARIRELAIGAESGTGMAARLVLEQLGRLERQRDAAIELCRGARHVDAGRVLSALGAPDET